MHKILLRVLDIDKLYKDKLYKIYLKQIQLMVKNQPFNSRQKYIEIPFINYKKNLQIHIHTSRF